MVRLLFSISGMSQIAVDREIEFLHNFCNGKICTIINVMNQRGNSFYFSFEQSKESSNYTDYMGITQEKAAFWEKITTDGTLDNLKY